MFPDVHRAARRRYSILPVPKDLIPSTGESKAQILWVGCSDSWITETAVLDVLPQETFVHRNLGSVMSNGDLSSASAIAYCVDLLEVKHIVVCGHYDCVLFKEATLAPTAIHGWYEDLSRLRAANDALLPDVDSTERDRHLAEVYVLTEVEWLRSQPTVAKAIAERGLGVHAFVFDKEKEACVRLVEEGGEQAAAATEANGGPNGIVA
ncbi:hypothetical protein V493_04103 [Pseudogymnoascus sp. VKM F-4281 (FW-2241)]|nr:hypothetical protein V493_04103 [Pseudogymnoascus sp. VKM F-4281 (FW-2241)]